jgi:flavodoxin
MLKILITYFTVTGNTKQIAQAIFDALEGEKEIKPLDEVQDMDAFSTIFIGFPVHSHSVPFKVEKFIKRLPEKKKIALFCTHGSLSGGRLSREAIEHAAALAAKAVLLGTFSCRGGISPQAMEVLSRSPEHKAWLEMAATARTHPDESDIEDARSFARWVVTLSHQA